MNVKNWLVFENQRDAYILDGVKKNQAVSMAKKDCRNNPYDEAIKKIQQQELRDFELLHGAIGKQKYNSRTKGVNIKSRMHFFNNSFFIPLILFIIAAMAIRILIMGTIVYFLWNILLVKAFSFSMLTWEQSFVIGVILAFILPTNSSKD